MLAFVAALTSAAPAGAFPVPPGSQPAEQKAAPPTEVPQYVPPPATLVPVPVPSAPPATRPPPPVDAAGALERARAAYEYGDIDEMVESARQISEGHLRPTPAQRASALRYLGIGLFLTHRQEGAETAFFELLRLRPESRLDPQTTRPDVVAFFEQVRLRYAQPIQEAARASNRKVFAWNFFPPAGQFQNGHTARAYTIAGLEIVSLATALTTLALLKSWELPGHQFSDPDQARAVKMVNWASIGVLAATVAYGIIDGIAHYPEIPDDAPPPPATTRLTIGPGGLALDF